MTDPTLMPAVADAAPEPRRQFAVQTFTAIYDPVEDRIRLYAMDKKGVKQSILPNLFGSEDLEAGAWI